VALHSGGAPIHLRKDAFLAAAETGAREASEKAARAHHVQVTWTRTWDIPPRLFDETLLGFVRESVREVTGRSPELPSGPLHDAAEMVPLMPTAMIFAQSSPGVSHTRIEDTPEPCALWTKRWLTSALEPDQAQRAALAHVWTHRGRSSISPTRAMCSSSERECCKVN
jgi:hypothetical protein